MNRNSTSKVFLLIVFFALYLTPFTSKAQLSIVGNSDLYISKGEMLSFDGISFTPDANGSGYTFPATTLEKTAQYISSTGFLNPHLKKYYSFNNPITGFSGSIIFDHSDVDPKISQSGTDLSTTSDLRLNVYNGTIWTVPQAGTINSNSVEGINISNGTISTLAVASVNAALPVSLLSFSGRVVNAGVSLNWVTASEFNSSHFDVERSGNGTSFAKIGNVKAAGNSSVKKNYEYLDATPLPKQSWYRLKQVDLDGKFTYSSVLPITRDAKISSYPNPVSNHLQLQLSQDWKGTYDLMIFDNTGRLMMKQQVKAGSYMFDCANWANGIYNVIIHQDNQQVYEQKILKN